MALFQQYLMSKEFHSQIQQLRKRGGLFNKAANEAADLVIKINSKTENPFSHLNTTHYGESRIKHCVKYDLPGFVRLVTIQDNGVCLLAYLGDKDDTEKWLESKKGLNLTIDTKNKVLVPVRISEDIQQAETRISAHSDYSEGRLHLKLKDFYFKKIADEIPYSQLKPFLEFESTTQDDEILEAVSQISNHEYQTVFFDVFLLLREGDVDQAQNRVLEFEQKLKLVAEASKSEISEVKSDDHFLNIQELESEYLKTILETKGWYEWMIFLHPAQNDIVKTDYKGSARLLGVSGSGKTSVLVHRAVRLSEKYNEKPILILTLNKSLAKLIDDLLGILLSSKQKTHLRDRIQVSSFWELCRKELLKQNSSNLHLKKILSDITEKTGETIDEIWEEFYCCKANNSDAQVIFPLHQSLLARSIFPQEYLRQEFDWIRSAFPSENRDEYLSVDRDGRYIPIIQEDRKCILQALKSWEEKMEFVGAVDYLHLSNLMYNDINQISADYACILVDEIQDFGTIELAIIRRLVNQGENDLFLCGDIAQQVYNKQHKLKVAGINILPEGFVKILKNYRNSREILQAAYAVFDNNVEPDKLKSDDFEVLKPEYANFSSPKPFLRKGDNLNQELNYAYEYLKKTLDKSKNEKGCIAICGISFFHLVQFSKAAELPILDGAGDLSVGSIFLSDLEQTKGFEFDKMIVINCNEGIFPNGLLPKEEWFREISKLYVAMTRAKKELTISYSTKISTIFEKCEDLFLKDNWKDHELDLNRYFDLAKTEVNSEISNMNLSVTGQEFLYYKPARGISRELQNKLIEIVAGRNITDDRGRRVGWMNLSLLKSDVVAKRDLPTLTRIFGATVYKELENLLS